MSKDQLWQLVLSELELKLSRANFITWLNNTSVASLKNEKIVINCPNNFVKEWLDKKLRKTLLNTIKTFSPQVEEIQYNIQPNEKNLSVGQSYQKQQSPLQSQIMFPVNKNSDLLPKYTFSNFIVGSFNELAYVAAKNVTKNPGKIYNPYFVYGGVGLGKTHIIQAIGNEIFQKKKKNIKIKYILAPNLTSKIISSIRTQVVEKYIKELLSYNVLIVDDIEFLSGKEKTQEIFFRIFNELYQKNAQIVLSSDRSPKLINNLGERLRSRFEGGMVVDIGLPDFETRMAILNQKIESKGIVLEEEILEFIAQNITNNIREIEGALNRAILLKEYQKNTKEIINNLKEILNTPSKNISPNDILKEVSNYFNISQKDILKNSRKKEIVYPRQVYIYILRSQLNLSFPSIASNANYKDHTTVIYAFKKIENNIKKNINLKRDIDTILQNIYNKV